MQLIYSLFNRKYSAFICIILAILNRVINVMFVSFAGADKMTLVLQAKSLLQGHGLSRPFYYFSNTDTPVWDFTPRWPPGYPVLLAPFLKIFNYNVYWATTALDLVVCIAFIFTVRKICRQIQFSEAATNIATLIAGTFEYTFIHESLPTDTVSLVFLLIGVMLSINCLYKSHSFLHLFIAGFFLFSPCLFRYSYPPVSLAIPCTILLVGVIKRDTPLIKKAFLLLISTALFLGVLFLFIKIFTGKASFIVETQRGVYPENIIHWFPFFPSSFINVGFLASQLIQKAGTTLTQILLLLETINGIALGALIILFFYLLRKKFFYTLSPFKWFLLTGYIISVLTVLSLGYLSFTYHVQEGFYGGFNYIGEGRYFAFINIFLQLIFIGWLTLYRNSIKGFALKSIAAIGIVFLFIEVSHNIYFHTKIAINDKFYKSAVYREQHYNYFDTTLPELANKYSGYEILVASPGDSYYYHTATYLGYKGIADATPLKVGQPIVKKTSILLVWLFDYELEKYKNCLQGNNVALLKKIGISNFYLIKLEP